MHKRQNWIVLAMAVLLAANLFAADAKSRLPQLVDLGADKCIPCRMMKPVLDELSTQYAGQLDVIFIDVWKDRGAGTSYNIRAIPTQVFFSPEGKELFRHEGFYPKEEILKKWKELGYEFKPASEGKPIVK
jgi:thioredoxin 1